MPTRVYFKGRAPRSRWRSRGQGRARQAPRDQGPRAEARDRPRAERALLSASIRRCGALKRRSGPKPGRSSVLALARGARSPRGPGGADPRRASARSLRATWSARAPSWAVRRPARAHPARRSRSRRGCSAARRRCVASPTIGRGAGRPRRGYVTADRSGRRQAALRVAGRLLGPGRARRRFGGVDRARALDAAGLRRALGRAGPTAPTRRAVWPGTPERLSTVTGEPPGSPRTTCARLRRRVAGGRRAPADAAADRGPARGAGAGPGAGQAVRRPSACRGRSGDP